MDRLVAWNLTVAPPEQHRKLVVLSELSYHGGPGRTALEMRCLAQGGSAGCGHATDVSPVIGVTASVDNRQADFDLWTWSNVPEGVGYVTYVDGDTRYWQRPVAGVVAFPNVEGDEQVAVAFDHGGAQVAGATGQPRPGGEVPDGSEWADISKSELEQLTQTVQHTLRQCLTRHGVEPVTPDLLTLPSAVNVSRTWEVCVNEAQPR